MQHQTLTLARDGPVMKITLDRPDVRNALSHTMLAELAEAFAAARDDAGVRVVVLAGSGGNFCAGGDFRGMEKSGTTPGTGTEAAASNRRFGALLETIDALPKAVLCLIEGACMGGGVGLAAVADWVIAEQGARIGTPEVTVGIVPAQITPFVVRRIGAAHGRRLCAFGLRLTAAEAARVGLVHEIAEGREQLTAMGAAAVEQVLRCAPDAVAQTKALVRRSAAEPLGAALDDAAHMFAASLAGEAREGIRAFLEKRKPAWTAKTGAP